MSSNDESAAISLSPSPLTPPGQEETQQSSSRPAKRRRTNIVTLQCPYCPRTIVGDPSKSIRTNYNRHLLTHTGERPYQCEFCLARFTTSTNRRRHILRLHQDFVGTLTNPPKSSSALKKVASDAHGAGESVNPDTNGANLSAKAVFFCRFCNTSFSCKGSRTLHERHCSSRTEPPRNVSSSSLLQPSTSVAVVGCSTELQGNPADTFVLCPNCEQELSGRQQLKRHLKYYCPFRDDVFASCDGDENDYCEDVWDEMGMRSRTKRSRRILTKRSLGTAKRASQQMLPNKTAGVVLTAGAFASADAYLKGGKTVVCPYDDCMSTFFSRTRWLAHVARRHPHELLRDVAGSSAG